MLQPIDRHFLTNSWSTLAVGLQFGKHLSLLLVKKAHLFLDGKIKVRVAWEEKEFLISKVLEVIIDIPS